MDEKKIEEELKKIWDETPVSNSDNEKEISWAEFHSKAFTPKKKKFKIWRYATAAAVLVLMSVGTGMYLSRDFLQNDVFLASTVIENKTIKVKTILLPDSSKVELSPNSKISYANNFVKNRKIEMQGESYFKVRKDKEHPFQVVCNETTTTVLGTSFTVKESNQREVIVALYEGSVQLSVKNNNNKWILKPGEKFTYGNNISSVAKFDRFMDFENQKLSVVTNYIESNYGYKVIIPKEYYNQRMTFRINKKEDLKTILELISEMYNLNVEVNEKIKQITFQ